MPPLSSLPDEFVEEVLLRLPPDPPASLVRAGLVCKRWCRLVSGAGFRRRFREFHRRSHPILGFLYDQRDVAGGGGHVARFIPMPASFPPHHHAGHRGMSPWDSRHGRVLLRSYHLGNLSSTIVVWDPITDHRLELPKPPPFSSEIRTMAILCAAVGCDHLDCHGGPFLVVLMGTKGDKVFSYVYSSEAGTWSNKPTTSTWLHGEWVRDKVNWRRSELYFVSPNNKRIIEYDLDTREISVIDLPAFNSVCKNSTLCPALVQLTTMEDGRLEFTRVENFKLSLWSREVEDAGWVLSKVIDLGTCSSPGVLPGHWQHFCPYLIGSAEGAGVVFLLVKGELFTVDLRSKQITKVYGDLYPCIALVVPYLNFYTPVLRAPSTQNGPNTGVVPLSGSTILKPN
ncbi:hypothetical protein HU200_016456 [Digitaria exilis]|uniref:F-box domain-containing protein n=1 Tax=Digitaria exilis TaxID=1010633 RepID=A0A835KIH4_9POAL|nr:hypothetical protein HU200_016456 [Digitaria exilis]